MINRLHRIYSTKNNDGKIIALVYASPFFAIVLACLIDFIRNI